MNIPNNYFGFKTNLKDYPEEIFADLTDIARFSNDPIAWFVGQFVHYLMKPNLDATNYVNDYLTKKQLKTIKSPYAAIHVRRSDKLNEANYQSFDLYIRQVDEFFEQYFLNNPSQRGKVNKTVYIASDDAIYIQNQTVK